MNIIKAKTRIKEVLNKDKGLKSDKIVEVIKSDVFELLENYFIVSPDTVQVKIVQEGNEFVFSCSAKAETIKVLNYLK